MTSAALVDLRTMADDPAAFRRCLLIDTDAGPQPLAAVIDDWQRQDFEALDDSWWRVVGSNVEPRYCRAWLERPRGHSKTADLSVMVLWALAFSHRTISGIAAACDRDQANLLRDAIARLVRLNPWLAELVEVQAYRVINPHTGSALLIISSDVATSWGHLVDFIVCDEVCHWPSRELFDSLLSTAAKRAHCLLACIGNAGFLDSWQWAIREALRSDSRWYFHRLEGPVASWMTPDRLAEQRRLLPPIAFARLWENQWSTGGGDALTPADIAAAFRRDLSPMTGREPDFVFCGGLDLGLRRDSSAFVVLAADRATKRIRLAHHRRWKPTPGRKVDFAEVERHVRDCDKQFDLEAVAFDPWNAEHLASRLENDHRSRSQRRRWWTHPWMKEIAPTATNLRDQATLLIESFVDRRLELFDCEPLRRDLLKLRVEEKSYGCRLTSPRDADGHGDSASAFALALLAAHEQAGKKKVKCRVMCGSLDGLNWESTLADYRREMEELQQQGE